MGYDVRGTKKELKEFTKELENIGYKGIILCPNKLIHLSITSGGKFRGYCHEEYIYDFYLPQDHDRALAKAKELIGYEEELPDGVIQRTDCRIDSVEYSGGNYICEYSSIEGYSIKIELTEFEDIKEHVEVIVKESPGQ